MSLSANYSGVADIITTEQDLEQVLGKPGPRVLAKVVDRLDDLCRVHRAIALRPYCLTRR